MARQKEILGMRIQREYKGPAARLVDLLDGNDRSYVGVVFYEEYRNHSAITNSLDGLMEFLQCPVARGITPLHSYGYDEGAFIYETGKCKSIAELIRQASDLGLSPGPRAGLEMMTQALEILDGAIQIAEEYAIYSHGGLTPWRLMIRPDGKLQIIGFAVPQVEVLDFKSNPNLVPSEDSFRYAPPERMMMNEIEDSSSDLFGLGLIAFELMTTRPMYDGSTSAIQEAAQRADVSMKLNQAMMAGWFDQYTHDFLDRCLRLDPSDRFEGLSEALQAGKNLLRNPHLQGMSLFDLMSASNQHILRQSQDVEVLEGATAMFDRSSITEDLLAQEQERKRQKLAEVTLPSGRTEEMTIEKPKRTPIVEAPPKPPNTGNLLDLLRQSTTANIEVPPEPPEPEVTEEVAPASAASSNLLSALRSSIATDMSDVDTPIPTETTSSIPVEQTSTPPRDRSAVASKLSALISTPRRSAPVISPEPEAVPEVLAEIVAVEPVESKENTSTVAPVVDESIEVAEPVSSSESIPPTKSRLESLLFQGNASVEEDIVDAPILGDALLGDEFPDDDEMLDDDDGATAVMMRPVPNKSPSMDELPIKTKQKTKTASVQSKSISEPAKPSANKTETFDTPIKSTSKSSKPVVTELTASPNGQVQSIFDPPVPIRMSIPSANAVKYQISLGLGRGSIKQSVSPDATVSQVISLLLLNRLLPIRTDLMGSLTSCYRFMEKGEPCSGRRTVGSFNSRKLLLGSVPSRLLMCTISVQTDDGIIQYNAPINWIVPAASMLDHIVSWLRLNGVGWTISVDGQEMEPHDVLFDVVNTEHNVVLIVQQKRG